MGRVKLLRVSISLLSFGLFCCSAGCSGQNIGRMDAKIHSTVKPDGSLIQELTFEVSGSLRAVGTRLLQTFTNTGWQTKSDASYSVTAITATKAFRKEEMQKMIKVFVPVDTDGNYATIEPAGLNFKIDDYLVVKYTTLSFTVPQTAIDSTNSELAKLGDTRLNEVFSLIWAITLPGEITETNADYFDKDTATWNFKYTTLKNGRQITVKSRYIDWPLVLIISAINVMIVLFLYMITRRKNW